jgi:hypothetical protein
MSNQVDIMKKKLIYGCIFSLLLVNCEEVDDLLTFHVNDRTAIRIENTVSVGLPLDIPTPDVSSDSEQQYENHNTHADLVKDVKLQELRLTITEPSGKNFSFLKAIRIFISTTPENEIELASLESINSTTSAIDLTPTSAKLDVYARASSYNLRTEVTTDEALTQSVDVQVDLKFRVTADTF